jgi:hypothetical protein
MPELENRRKTGLAAFRQAGQETDHCSVPRPAVSIDANLLWQKIEEILAPGQGDRAAAEAILADIEAGPALGRTQTSLLIAPDPVVAALFASLERRVAGGRFPLADPPHSTGDPSWMTRSDFCYLSVRACAHEGVAGSFIQAAKLLPAIAADAIHLAPFHPIHFDVVYAPESPSVVDPALADPVLTAAGIGPENQLRAFMRACRLLGKAVGYDLMPYVAQFARVALERPGLFRWIQLDSNRAGLVDADPACPYGRKEREDVARMVAGICTSAKDDYGISSLKRLEGDDEATTAAKDRAYYTAIRMCIENGIWQVPCHAWNGAGAPAFSGYDHAADYPVFAYRNDRGEDVSAEAYGVSSPYAFYDGLLPNSITDPDYMPTPHDKAVEYFSSIFSSWSDRYGFDFVRIDAVDRLLWSSLDPEGTLPVSDGLTPQVVRRALEAARQAHPGIGALASRYGTEVDEFAREGFDLLMGYDMMRRVDAPLLRESLALYDRLVERNADPVRRRATVCFAVDSHETSSPRQWGAALATVMGPLRMGLRHAVARFLSVGGGRRPLYEVMGFQDLSTGLYESSLASKGLQWNGNAAFAKAYAGTEGLYRRLRPFLDTAAITARYVCETYAWWIIVPAGRSGPPHRVVVVALSLETGEGLDPGYIEIPLPGSWGELEGRVRRIPGGTGQEVSVSGSLGLQLQFLECVIVELEPSQSFY